MGKARFQNLLGGNTSLAYVSNAEMEIFGSEQEKKNISAFKDMHYNLNLQMLIDQV